MGRQPALVIVLTKVVARGSLLSFSTRRELRDPASSVFRRQPLGV